MTDDDVQSAAHRTCFKYTHANDPEFRRYEFGRLTLLQFAAIIRRAALEEAAKVCDDTAKDYDESFAMDHSGGAERCAAAIRALSQKDPQ